MGTPVAGRNRAELEGLIGLFINSLVLRLSLVGDPGFERLLTEAREVALGAFSHQDLPFAKLVSELSPDRNLGHTPLFQVQLLLVEADFGRLDVPGLTLTPAAVEESTSKLDLTLRARAKDRGMTLEWLYNSDLFDATTILRLGSHFAALLAGLAEPGRPLSAFPLLTPGEAHQVRAEWNDTATPGWWAPEPGTLHERIAEQAARTPDDTAAVYEGESLTYGELLASARRLARRLRAQGVGPDVAVGMFAERSLEMVVGLLAILEAGGAYLPLDPAYPADRLAYMVADAAAPVILAQDRLLARLPGHGAVVVSLDGTARKDAAPEPALPGGAGADNLAYVIYTSGSTGRPKGTMNSHRGIVNRLLWMQGEYGLTAEDRVLQKTPFSFDVSVWEFFWPLLTGARLVMAVPGGHQDPAYLAATIAKEGITTLHFVPSLLRVFVDAPGLEACTSLRRVMASGEALPLDLVRKFHDRLTAELHNLYGPTEAAVDVTYWACAREDGRGVVPIGRPVANTRIVVLDGEGRPAPVGVPGELHIGGVQLARGYWKRPDLTAEKFVPDPLASLWSDPGARLYRTGDLARTLADGAVEFLGRIDHQVKLRGLRIELGEIEAALDELPGVKAAVVMARADGGETRLVAYVVADPAPELSEIRTVLSRSLPEYMLPSALVVLAAMPLTPSGKVDRKALPAPELRRGPADIEAVAPRTPLEAWVAGSVPGRSGCGRCRRARRLLRPGGLVDLRRRADQSLAARASGEIVHVVVIFDHPTVARLAAYLGAQHAGAVPRDAGWTAIPRARRDSPEEPLPLSFAQERLWFLDRLDPGNSTYNLINAVRLSGPLDIPSMERALAEVVRRHEALRTVFADTASGPVQVVVPAFAPPLPRVDLAGLPGDRREPEARRRVRREAVRLFDLRTGPAGARPAAAAGSRGARRGAQPASRRERRLVAGCDGAGNGHPLRGLHAGSPFAPAGAARPVRGLRRLAAGDRSRERRSKPRSATGGNSFRALRPCPSSPPTGRVRRCSASVAAACGRSCRGSPWRPCAASPRRRVRPFSWPCWPPSPLCWPASRERPISRWARRWPAAPVPSWRG